MKGKPVRLEAGEEPQSAEVIDLMERLRQSLQGAKSSAGRTRKKAAKTAARTKKKRAA